MNKARHQIYGSKKKGHSTRNLALAAPGAVYSFEKNRKWRVSAATERYLGRWANEDDVAEMDR